MLPRLARHCPRATLKWPNSSVVMFSTSCSSSRVWLLYLAAFNQLSARALSARLVVFIARIYDKFDLFVTPIGTALSPGNSIMGEFLDGDSSHFAFFIACFLVFTTFVVFVIKCRLYVSPVGTALSPGHFKTSEFLGGDGYYFAFFIACFVAFTFACICVQVSSLCYPSWHCVVSGLL